METLTRTRPESTHFAPPGGTFGPIIVGTSGSADADAAISMAQLLAAHTGAGVEVITIVTHLPIGYSLGFLPYLREDDLDQREAQQRIVRDQVARFAGHEVTWPVNGDFGEAAQALTEAAQVQHARLIIVGRGKHSMKERLLGGEQVVRMLQLGDTPVLATAPGVTSLPTKVVIATDFSAMSAHAAQVAIPLISPSATVFLVNVMPNLARGGGWERDWAVNYREGLAAAFENATAAITRTGMTVIPKTLEGDAAETLVEFCNTESADLVVCATHGHGFLRRMILGSVANELVRNANCSVLCVPVHATQAESRETA